jgi:PAS domain S-box-containing protein
LTGTVPAYPRAAHGPLPLWDLTLAQLPVPVAVYDRDARLVGASHIMTDVMGRSEEEMRGLTLREIEPNPPFDTYDRLQREVLRTGEMIFHEEHATAPGEIRPHAWSMFLSPLKDETGTVQGMSATGFDTTEQSWARRRLAVINEASLRIGSTLDVKGGCGSDTTWGADFSCSGCTTSPLPVSSTAWLGSPATPSLPPAFPPRRQACPLPSGTGRGVRTGMPADTRGTPTILQAGLRAVRRRKESRV